METETLLKEIIGCGLSIQPIGDNLHVWPRALITERILQSIRTMKSSLIEFLEQYEERAAIMEYDGGMDRAKAEAAAKLDIYKFTGDFI